MNLAESVLVVLCTCPDSESARRIAETLVGAGLAACVSEIPGLVSTYSWQGEVRREQETQLLIKTTAAAYAALETALREAHPYELPEILAVPVSEGLGDYLAWVAERTGS